MSVNIAPGGAPGEKVEVSWWGSPRAWVCIAVLAAIVPFAQGFTGARVFYIRDLSMFFWGRHIWLRRELLSGAFPLWDPYVGAGQSAVADALHQLFLLPALVVRLLGSEVFGFNLWVAVPFPLAALGAWLFFARRFSAHASALGAIAFSVSGPTLSTFNFPNMSWSVAAMPWVLWTADRAASRPTRRHVAALAAAVALQALAGEPVTLLATLVVTVTLLFVVTAEPAASVFERFRAAVVGALGIGLGLLVASVQLVPLARAAAQSERAGAIAKDFWSIHPVALLETVSLHLFGDYYTIQSLAFAPWMTALNTGRREPFLLSIYIGVPLLALAAFGLASGRPRRWAVFWTGTGAASVVCAFGGYSPVYPFLQDHLPLLSSFRFPAKYLVVLSMVIAAAAAAGWDAIEDTTFDGKQSMLRRARLVALGLAAAIGAAAAVAAAACMYFPNTAAFRFVAFARYLHVEDPVAAAIFTMRTLPRAASLVLVLSFATLALVHLSTATRHAAIARRALYGLIVIDLLVQAYGLSPALDPTYLAEPAWLSYVRADPDSRFYLGGKRDGMLDATDLDSGGAYLNAPGLSGSASRAALSGQADFYPSGWRSREMLSYDLPVLWPKIFASMTTRFSAAGRAERDLFLDRTGVRFRVLPRSQASGRTPMMPVPYLLDSFLYDWDGGVAPRVSVVRDAKLVPDVGAEVEALFQDGWNPRETVLIERETESAGNIGQPEPAPSARIVADAANRVGIEAGVPAAGGYLVLLDSYADDWRVTVDGQPASLVRANGLFRAVRLNPGRHAVVFSYRPRAFVVGAALSSVALLVMAGLLWPRRRRQS